MRTEARDTLIKALPEAEYNLVVFDQYVHENGPARFMVLKVGGDILDRRELLEACVGSIAYLGKLGFTPVVIHGGGTQINQRLDQAGIKSHFEDGLRVTSPEAMGEIALTLDKINSLFDDELEKAGGYAKGFPRAFEATYLNRRKYGEVGVVSNLNAQAILEAFEDGRIPVLSCLGRLASGEGFLNINADDAAAYVARILRPLKYVSMTVEGGVKDDKETIIPVITPELAQDLEKRGLLTKGKRKKVEEGLALVNAGVTSDVVIVHPAKLIEELFTHEGQGTLITSGVYLKSYEGQALAALDNRKIVQLIELAFDGSLVPGYLEQKEIAKIILTPQTYDGVGTFLKPEDQKINRHGIFYMDKLAVEPHARGRGVAQEILEEADTDGLFWRASADNPYLDKYETLADGSRIIHAADEKTWIVFWRNVLHKIIPSLIKAADKKTWKVFWRNVPPEIIPSLLKYAQSRPVTIYKNPRNN